MKYDTQHTFAIFRGDLVTYNSAIGNSNQISSTGFSAVTLPVSNYISSLSTGSQIYASTVIYNIGGTYTCKIADMLHYLTSQSTVKNIEIVTDPERLRHGKHVYKIQRTDRTLLKRMIPVSKKIGIADRNY